MATYPSTSFYFQNGVVAVSSQDGTNYNAIQQSMGSYVYRIDQIYIAANSTAQILEPFIFERYDSNGDIEIVEVIPAIDPFQYQNAYNIEFQSKDFILDGRTKIEYNIKADQKVFINLKTMEINNSNFLNGKTDIEEDFLKTYGFFNEYTEKIPINFGNDKELPAKYSEIECD
jgi:hypothetical protein